MSPRFRLLLSALLLVAVFGGCSSPVFTRKGEQSDRAPAAARHAGNPETGYQDALKLIEKLEYDPAAEKLQQVFIQFDAVGNADYSAKSLFWLGFCREKLHRDDLARETYVTVIERFAESKSAKSAQQRLDAMNQVTNP